MIQVDVWSWKCARCTWEVRSQMTVNAEQGVAESLIRLHIIDHDKAEMDALFCSHGYMKTSCRQCADEALIADLLKLASWVSEQFTDDDDQLGEMARAAIAKAEGR